MRRTTLALTGLLAALALILAGCGGTVSQADFTVAFAKVAPGSGLPFSEKQLTCLGNGIYDEVDSDKVNELNDEMTDGAEFPKDLVGPLAKVGPTCVAAGDLMKAQLGSTGITPEQTDCVAKGMNDNKALNQQVWDAIAASAAGDESKLSDPQEVITELVTLCISA